MNDFKHQKPKRYKANRAKKKKEPIRWKKVFHRTLLVTVRTTTAAMILVGSVLGAKLLLSSDMFHIDQITVQGVQRLKSEDVVARSDIRLGQSIFDVDLEKIGHKLATRPWIRQAQVQRVFPRQIEVRIVERQPVAIANLGYLYYVDAHGDLFKSLTSGDRLDFPMITGLSREQYLEKPEETRIRLREAVTLIAQLKNRRVFSLEDVAELKMDRGDGVRLYTYNGAVPIELGTGHYAAKIDRLETVYKEIRPNLSSLTGVDLRVEDRVIVRMKKAKAQHG